MGIVIAIIEAIALALALWVYLARADVLKAEGFSGKVKAALKCRRIIKIYSAAAMCAMIFLAIWLEVMFNNAAVTNMKNIALIGLLFPLAYEDFFIRRISNKIILTGLITRLVFFGLEAIFSKENFWGILKQSLIGFLVGVVFLILGTIVVRNGIGMGDVKMIMMMGLFQGFYPVMVSLMFSLIVSFFIAVVFLIRRIKGRKDTLPFAPNVLIGTFLSVMFVTTRAL